jgi:hypothetical protein
MYDALTTAELQDEDTFGGVQVATLPDGVYQRCAVCDEWTHSFDMIGAYCPACHEAEEEATSYTRGYYNDVRAEYYGSR